MLLNRLLDGFDGKLTRSKWAAIGNCSQDTALRDITELVERPKAELKIAGSGQTFPRRTAPTLPVHPDTALR